MMRLVQGIAVIVPLVGGILVVACGDDPVKPALGSISVAVWDGGDPSAPVPEVPIEIAPVNRILNTNQGGVAVFVVVVGEYFVNASVCCAGPGFIEYHVPVTVVANDTASVVLPACLGCVCKPSP